MADQNEFENKSMNPLLDHRKVEKNIVIVLALRVKCLIYSFQSDCFLLIGKLAAYVIPVSKVRYNRKLCPGKIN